MLGRAAEIARAALNGAGNGVISSVALDERAISRDRGQHRRRSLRSQKNHDCRGAPNLSRVRLCTLCGDRPASGAIGMV